MAFEHFMVNVATSPPLYCIEETLVWVENWSTKCQVVCSRLLNRRNLWQRRHWAATRCQLRAHYAGFLLLAGNVPGNMSVKLSFLRVEDKFLPEKLELWLNFTREEGSFFPQNRETKRENHSTAGISLRCRFCTFSPFFSPSVNGEVILLWSIQYVVVCCKWLYCRVNMADTGLFVLRC